MTEPAGAAAPGAPAGGARSAGKPRPTGTVTFLFTDIEGSTALWERHPDLMQVAFARQEALVRGAILTHGGYPYKQIGDAFQAAFQAAPQALAAALAAQRALAAEDWGDLGALRVRMALHTGQTEERPDDYVGPLLNRVARLLAAGYGGQVLLSAATAVMVRDGLGEDLGLRDLGAQRLRDLAGAELVYQLLAPDLPGDFPPLRTLGAPTHNLPAPAGALVGREAAEREVRALLAEARLVTLVGSGGVGKTRLAVAVAAELVGRYADGVWLVELAALAEPGLVAGTVARVLGVREEADRPILQTLTDTLTKKRTLLLLDNCEHLVAACAELAAALLRACPQLRILATSREGLEVAGERRWRVPSLSVPDPAQVPTPELVGSCAAVRLFVARAQERRPDFALTAANARAVVEVCARLDGIPLAIELAAARVGVLAVEGIAARLDDRFRLLTGGGRDALPRQRTLRGVLDWSYDLLSGQEQVLLDRLSAFAGGCALGAIEAVCAGDEVEDWELLDLLGALVNKSLVQAEERADGEVRYGLLETVRQYGQERLAASGGTERVRNRHLRWCLALADAAAAHLQGDEQAQWLDRLEVEHDNLRAALAWALDGGETALGLQLAAALSPYWDGRSHCSEGRRWLENLLAVSDAGTVAPELRARALMGAALLTLGIDDSARADALSAEGLALYRALGDTGRVAEVLGHRGILARMQGRYAQAVALLEESLALNRALGEPAGTAFALYRLGVVTREVGDYARSTALYQESLALYRALGDPGGTTLALLGLGDIARDRGDAAQVERYSAESLTICKELGRPWGIGYSLNNLALAAAMQGDLPRAQTLAEGALALFRAHDIHGGVGEVLESLARLACDHGNFRLASARLVEALPHARRVGPHWLVATGLEEMARVAVAQRQVARAARLCGAASSWRRMVGVPMQPYRRAAYEDTLAGARQALGDDAFAAAWAAGEALPLEQAVAEALAAELE